MTIIRLEIIFNPLSALRAEGDGCTTKSLGIVVYKENAKIKFLIVRWLLISLRIVGSEQDFEFLC